MTISSCTVFKTINVDATEQALKSVSPIRTVVTIQEKVVKNVYSQEFVLENFIIENDSIKGIVITPPEGERHSLYEETFNSKWVKAYDPLSTMHIFTTLSQINPGAFGMPVDSIELIEIHEKHERKSTGQTVAVVVVSTVLVAGITYLIVTRVQHNLFN